ncbi:hypothetical protein [Pontibacterium sp.]|uniref:PAS domain-containing protein n=2 Tax=Pontibacterium sp. TaxID=2036026 RepID=UPI0035113FFC
MVNNIKNQKTLDIFNEVEQPIFIVSNQKNLIWCNDAAENIFDKKIIEDSIKHRNFLLQNYENGARTYQLIFNTKIGIPVTFSVFYDEDYDIYISSHLINQDIERQKEGLTSLIEQTLIQKQKKLKNQIKAIQTKIRNRTIRTANDIDFAMECLSQSAEILEQEWKKIRSSTGTFRGCCTSNERTEVEMITRCVEQQLSAHSIRTNTRLLNKRYGVIYGGFDAICNALSGLIASSLAREAGDRDVTLSVYQSSKCIIWEWQAEKHVEDTDLVARYIWLSFQGQLQEKADDGSLVLMASLPSGASINKSDLDLSIWAENEIQKIIT